jgi:type II secretory pathway component PulK
LPTAHFFPHDLGPDGESASFAIRSEAEQGIALIAVLWMLVLLSVVAAALALETHSSTRIASNMAEKAAARAAADAGIQRAILDLETPLFAKGQRFRTDGTVYDWRFGNSNVRISIRVEASKVDLNQAPEPVLSALFQLAGISQSKAQSLAAAVADFRDRDNLPRANGAESDAYRSAGLSWGPKNAPFQSIDELRQVIGITPEIYGRVADDITVYSMTSVAEQSPAGLAKFLLQAKSSAQLSPDVVASIRAVSRRPSGAVFIRETVVQPYTGQGTWTLSWDQRNPG